jgi:CheY-like chemotaxis protein
MSSRHPAILVVEHNRFLRDMICDWLGGAGYTAHAASDEHDALAWLNRRSMDRLHLLLVATGLLFWVAPHVVSRSVSVYRSEALLVGLVGPLVRLPREALLALLVLLVALGFGMTLLFFESILV